MDEIKANQLNILSLAFVGDAVFTLYIRQMLASTHDSVAGKLHTLANKYVKATSQAVILDELLPSFSQREADVARRARNHHNASKAKNAGLADYRKATAFEAVLGYLKMSEKEERLNELLTRSVEIIQKKENENE